MIISINSYRIGCSSVTFCVGLYIEDFGFVCLRIGKIKRTPIILCLYLYLNFLCFIIFKNSVLQMWFDECLKIVKFMFIPIYFYCKTRKSIAQSCCLDLCYVPCLKKYDCTSFFQFHNIFTILFAIISFLVEFMHSCMWFMNAGGEQKKDERWSEKERQLIQWGEDKGK